MKYSFWILNTPPEPTISDWFQGHRGSPNWHLYRQCLFPYASLQYDANGTIFDDADQELWHDTQLVRQ